MERQKIKSKEDRYGFEAAAIETERKPTRSGM
jgi:hypothetical protein